MKDLKTVLFESTLNAQLQRARLADETEDPTSMVEMSWQFHDGLLTAAGLKEEYERWLATPAETPAEVDIENKMVSVTMSHADWSHLTSYILMSTAYRNGEREAWEELAKETLEDGSPKFPLAPKNAQFWREFSADIDRIRDIIDKR